MRKVDYDARLYGVYAAGREMSPEALQTWMKAFARHLPGTRPLVWLDLGSGTGTATSPTKVSTRYGFGAVAIGSTGSGSISTSLGHEAGRRLTERAGLRRRPAPLPSRPTGHNEIVRPKSDGGPPRYQAIMRELMDEIRSGTPPVGSRLPTEADLGARFEAGRHTIRDAVRGLVELGVVARRPRTGTRVIASEPNRRYEVVPSTSDGVVSNMQATWIAAPTGTPVVADNALASQLGCEAGARWYRHSGTRVLREGEQRPVCFSDEYVRDTARARRSMAELVRAIPTEGAIEQEIRAELLNDDEARALKEHPGAPALVVVRRYWDPAGVLVAVMRHSHPATRFSIRMTLPTA